MMTTAEKYVARRYPEADVYPSGNAFKILDDADQNDEDVTVLGTGATEAEAWAAAARALGSKR